MSTQITEDFPCPVCERTEAAILKREISGHQTVFHLLCLFDPCGTDFVVETTVGGEGDGIPEKG